MNRSLRAFTHRSYLYIWLGSLLSNVGNWMENVGQGWVVASQTHSAFQVELLSFAQFLPVIFLVIPAGIIADRFDRRKVLLAAQVAMTFFAAVLAVLAHLNLASPATIIVITFFEGASWALCGPAWQSVMPQLVSMNHLESAISLNSIQFNIARLIGPAIAGFVVASFGFAYAFDLNVLSFLAVIAALLAVKFEAKMPKPTGESGGFRYAWKWVSGHRGARRILFSIATFAVLAAPIQGLMPFFASDVMRAGPQGLGNLLACLGAGAITGAFLLGQLPAYYPRHHLIPLSMVILGFFVAAYSQMPTITSAYPILYLGGIFWLWTMVSCNTAMQLLVPDSIRGRAMSILLVFHVGMLPLGHILGGVLARAIGPRTTLLTTSIGLIVIGTITLIRRVPEIDGMVRKASRVRFRTFFSEVILASSHRAEALSLDRSSEDR